MLCFNISGVPSLFLFYQKKVYELMKFKEEYRSWFIDNSVQKGKLGCIYPISGLEKCVCLYQRKFIAKTNFHKKKLKDNKFFVKTSPYLSRELIYSL